MTQRSKGRWCRPTIRPLLLCVSCAAAIVVLSSCNKSDLSTPKGAAETFVAALDSGDVETAEKASTGADSRFLQSLAKAQANVKKYRDAMASRFGPDGRRTVADKLKDADFKETGATAIVTLKGDPRQSILRKVSGEWKVDLSVSSGLGGALAAGYGDEIPASDLGIMLERINRDTIGTGLMEAIGNAAGEVAAELNAGKYSNATQARTAFREKLRSGG